MTQMVWITGVVAALGLAVVTVYLIILNWNQQLAGTVLSVFLGGIVTLFIAVFSQLKESSVSRQFAVDVPFDVATGFPRFDLQGTLGDAASFRRTAWLARLHSIAVQPYLPAPTAGTPTTIDLAAKAAPVSDDEMFVRCTQLIQYKLLEDLRDNQASSAARPLIVDGHEIPSIQAPALAGSVVDTPPGVLHRVLGENRFHVPHAFLWQYRTLRVPPKAQISLRHVASSQSTGVVKDLIVIERPNYYRGVLTIEPLGAGGTAQATVKTVRVAVSMKATTTKLAGGSSASAGARAWFEWLFAMLEEANAS